MMTTINFTSTSHSNDSQTTETNPHHFIDYFAKSGLEKITDVQAVLIICASLVVVLIVSMIICLCTRKSKTGYENLPNQDPIDDESARDIISEITARREVILPPVQSVPTTTSQLGHPSDNNLPSNNKSEASGSIQPDLPDRPSSTSSIKPDDEPKPSEVITESLIPLDNDYFVNAPGIQCPSRRRETIKLIPHDRITNPCPVSARWQRKSSSIATASSSEPSFTKVSMDEILSLSTKEKVTALSHFVLTPQVTPSSSHTSIDMNSRLQKAPRSEAVEDMLKPICELTLRQKKEEWDKFLQACSNKASSRRRSLCTVDECHQEEQSDPVRAMKVQSMPAIPVLPFTSKSTIVPASNFNISFGTGKENQRLKPGWIPPSLVFSPLGTLSQKIASMSLNTEELEEVSAAFSLLTKLSKGEMPKSSSKTSTTSVWSSIASENAFEPDRVAVCSRKTSAENMLWDNSGTPIGDSDSEENLKSNKLDLSHKRVKNLSPVREVKRLSTAERIDLAAKLLGYVGAEGSDDSGFLLESDIIPSEVFTKSRASSAVSSNDQFWTSGKEVHKGNFWAREVYKDPEIAEKDTTPLNELVVDPYQIFWNADLL